MIKKILLISTVVLIVFGFTSCRFMLDSDIGEFLKTDIAGHFLDDKHYTSYSSTQWDEYNYLDRRIIETFASDGSYLRVVDIYEDGSVDVDNDGNYYEGYLKWAEYEGSYTYKSAFLTLKKSYETNKTYYTSEWDSVNQIDVYTYKAVPNEYTYGRNDRKYSFYFTEDQYGNAYKPNLGKFTYTYSFTGDDGDFYKYEADISYLGDKLTFQYRNYDSDVEMPLIFNKSWEAETVIRLAEPIFIFSPGQTLDLEGEVEIMRERSYWNGDYQVEWDEDPYGSVGYDYSVSLTNYGDFIAF